MLAAEKEALTIERWAAWIGLATLLMVTSAAIFTAWDRAHTARLEQVITPTAVGDASCVREPPGGKGPIGLKYQGQALDMLSETKFRDSKLLRVGADDSGVYSLYRPEDESAGLAKGHYYMKVKPNEYMEVTGE